MKTETTYPTIIIWSQNQILIDCVNEIVNSIKIKININIVSDFKSLISCPRFLIFIDSDYLNTATIEIANDLKEKLNENECRIVVYGNAKKWIIKSMKLLLDEPIFEVSKKKINNLIKRSFNNTNTEKKKKEQQKVRLIRIINLYDTLLKKGEIDYEQAMIKFNVSAKTIQRDLDAIREATSVNSIDYVKNGISKTSVKREIK
jgi:hypothetical protein